VSRSIAYLASIIDDFNMSSDLSGVTDDHSSYREAPKIKNEYSFEHREEVSATRVASETDEDRNERIAARATLQNALHGIPKQQLFAEVGEFCRVHGLEEHQEVFRKGALLAQRPKEWDGISELSVEDKANIRYEHEHK
jgi:hypothetical protein